MDIILDDYDPLAAASDQAAEVFGQQVAPIDAKRRGGNVEYWSAMEAYRFWR